MSTIRPAGMPLLGAELGYPAGDISIYNGWINAGMPPPAVLDGYAKDDGNSGDSVATQFAQMINNSQDSCYQALGVISSQSGQNGLQCVPMMGIQMWASNEPPTAGLAALNSGSRDAYFAGSSVDGVTKDTAQNAIFSGAAKHGFNGTWWVRPAWEYNIGSQGNLQTSDLPAFVTGFQRIYTLVQAYNKANGCNIRVIWNPGQGNSISVSGSYPGKAYYDCCGIDSYGYPVNQGGGYDTDPQNTNSSDAFYSWIDSVNYAVNDGKTWIGCEIGVASGDVNFPTNIATLLTGSSVVVECIAWWADTALDVSYPSGIDLAFWDNTSSTASVKTAWNKIVAAKTATAKSLAVATPARQNTGATFAVSGTITGYSAAPTLQYSDNNSTWLALPSGNAVTTTTFSFTHPAITTVGTYTLYVRDANSTGTSAASAAYSVVAPGTGGSTTNWYQNPGQDGQFVKLPFQTTAQWVTSGAAITALRNGSNSSPTGVVNLKGNFAVPWVIGQATDPVVQVTNGSHSINVHIPLGTIIETPTSTYDQSIGGSDATQPYLVWSISGATMNTTSVQASGSVITGTYGMQVDDGAGLMMMDAVTGQPGTNNSFGGIQDYELSQAVASSTYVIPHMLAISLDPNSQCSGAGPVWPLAIVDTSSANTGTLPQGQTYGIPASTARPTGMTRGQSLLFDTFQQQGGFFYNVAAAGALSISVYSSLSANAALVTDLQTALTFVMQYMCILNNQSGRSSMKGMSGGTRSDAFPAPPVLDLSPSSGSEVAPSSFGAYYPSGYNVTPTAPAVGQSLSVTTPGQQNANASFAVSGTLGGYSAATTLNYSDNGSTWVALPTGNTVSATAFSFTHPGLAVGTYTLYVRDANNTAVSTSSGQYSVVAVTVPVVTITAPSYPQSTKPFTLSGTLTGYASAPALTVSDDSGAAASLPTGNAVTATTFTFTHAGLATGSHTTVISDGTNHGSITYSVTVIPGTKSADQTTVTSTTGYIVDKSGNVWSLTASGQIAVNGVVDQTTHDVTELAWVAGVVWQDAASGWYSTTAPGAGWTYSATSPFTNEIAITVTAPTGVQPNTAFSVTGSLANYTVIPTLTYADNSGTALALPSGSTVTLTAFSFTHPGMAAGSDTLTVSDGTVPNTVSYTVVQTGWTTLTTTTGLTTTLTATASTPYSFEVYATNSAGQGPMSAIYQVTTPAPSVVAPGVPTGLTSTSTSSNSVALSWTAPGVGTAPFTYQTQWSPTGLNSWTNGPNGSGTTASITLPSPSTTYDFQVNAANSAGTSAYSAIYTVATKAASTTVTWQPTGASSTMTFSNGNLTATAGGSATAGSTPQNCISTTTQSSGSYAFEVTMAAITQNCAIGLALATHGFASDLGSDTTSFGYYMSTGTGSQAAQTVYYNNNPVLAAGTAAADVGGATFTFCVTLGASSLSLWVTSPAMRTAYGSAAWNNSASANPATGTGAVVIALAGALSIDFNTAESGGSATLNAGSSTFSLAGIPSAFTAWSGATQTVVAPSQVTGLTAGTPGSTGVTLSWTASLTGTQPINYLVQQSAHSANSFTQIGSVTALTFSVTGLTASTAYDFRVVASNSAGNATASTIVTVTTTATATAPGAPSALSAGTATSTSVPLTWVAPTSGTTPVAYQMEFKLGTASQWSYYLPPVPVTQTLTVAGSITDVNSDVWKLPTVGGQLQFNGTVIPFTSAVDQLAYVNGTMWQRGTGNWYYFTYTVPAVANITYGGGTTTSPITDARQQVVPGPGTSITDSYGFVWTISGGQALISGTVITWTSNVTQLAYVNRVVWQKNASGNWYSFIMPAQTAATLGYAPAAGQATSPIVALAQTVTGLIASTTYDFQVFAQDAASNVGPVSSPPVVVTTPAAGTTAANFSISGGQIISPTGAAVVPKGVNVFGSIQDQAANGNGATPLTTRFPGINWVRLNSGPQSNNGTSSAVYPVPSTYLNFIQYCTGYTRNANGTWTNAGTIATPIMVIIEDHDNNSGNNPYTGAALTVQTNWYTACAQYYLGNPYVGFGTQNEMGNANYGNPGPTGSASHQAIYNAIRVAGGSNALLQIGAGIGGSNIGTMGPNEGWPTATYAAMHNIIWEIHCYYSDGGTDQYSDYTTAQGYVVGATTSSWAGTTGGWGIVGAQTIQSADGVMPVIIGEWGSGSGEVSGADANQITAELKAVRTLYGGVGSTAWICWLNSDTEAWTLTTGGGSMTGLTGWGSQVAGVIGSTP